MCPSGPEWAGPSLGHDGWFVFKMLPFERGCSMWFNVLTEASTDDVDLKTMFMKFCIQMEQSTMYVSSSIGGITRICRLRGFGHLTFC